MVVTIWIKFIICAALIFFAGKRIAKYADAISEKTGLSRLWVGIIFVSIATSLPELFTGIGSVAFVDAPNLAVGNVLGANTYNLLNLGILDLLSRNAPLLASVSSGQILTTVFNIIPIILLTIAIALYKNGFHVWSIANVGIFSIAIFISYCIITKIIYSFEKSKEKKESSPSKYGSITLKKTYAYYAVASFVIIASGIWLAYIGKELSYTLNLSHSFVGSLFIGLVTTLPEITVSLAALLIGAKEIAIANMLGSNLFNITIVFIDDLVYRKAPILQVVSPNQAVLASTVTIMTAIIILAMALKSKRRFFNISWYTPLLIIIFLLQAYLSFRMGAR